MPLPIALCQALHIDPNADEATALVAIQALMEERTTALNRAQTPPLDKFVPRADHDAALVRALSAEQQLNSLQAAQQQTAIDALIQQALTDGKISPATQDYYRAMCQTEGGLDEFEKFLAKAPKVLGTDAGLDHKSPTKPPTAEPLTTEQRAICQAMSIDPAEYAKNIKNIPDTEVA